MARAAVATTLLAVDESLWRPGHDASLCHGLAGLMETLLCAGRQLGDPACLERAATVAGLDRPPRPIMRLPLGADFLRREPFSDARAGRHGLRVPSPARGRPGALDSACGLPRPREPQRRGLTGLFSACSSCRPRCSRRADPSPFSRHVERQARAASEGVGSPQLAVRRKVGVALQMQNARYPAKQPLLARGFFLLKAEEGANQAVNIAQDGGFWCNLA